MREEATERPLVGRRQHDDAWTGRRREATVVEEIEIEGDERTAVVEGALEVVAVGRTPKVGVLEHEEDVPRQPTAHERDEPERHVRVDVDARGVCEIGGHRTQGGGECAHNEAMGEWVNNHSYLGERLRFWCAALPRRLRSATSASRR